MLSLKNQKDLKSATSLYKLRNYQEKMKSRASKKKEIIKIRAEINKIDKRKTIEEKSMKLKVGSSNRSTELTNLKVGGLRKTA